MGFWGGTKMDAAGFLHISAAILTVAGLFGWLNIRILKLPHTIALVLLALATSAIVLAYDAVIGGPLAGLLRAEVGAIQFDDTLMIGMLSFLLFAGALHVDLSLLMSRKWPILAMATIGVSISTAIIGFASYLILPLIGFQVPLIWCLVFGALISPTDPVAVLGILKNVSVPPSLEAKIAGESLFNDGVGVVVFTVLLAIAAAGDGHGAGHGPETIDAAAIAMLFGKEVFGGILIGLIGGWIAYYLMKTINKHNVEVLITLALVTTIYSVCLKLHTSGPLAVVIAGLFIGNHGAKFAMSEHTREHVTTFWELIDEILNSVLFLLIGLEVLVVGLHLDLLTAIVIIVPVVLAARFVAVAVPMTVVGTRQELTEGAIPVLVWAGLRGGISVALALSLPEFERREVVLAMTYGVVICSLVGQGLTVERVIKRFVKQSPEVPR